MKRQSFVLLAVILLTASPAAVASSGVVLTLESEDGEQENVARTTIYAQGDLVRVDDADVFGRQTSLVFDGERLVIIDHRAERFATIDEKGLLALRPNVVGASAPTSIHGLGTPDSLEDEPTATALARTLRREAQGASDTPDAEVLRRARRSRTSMFHSVGLPAREPLHVAPVGSKAAGEYGCRWHTVSVGPRKMQAVCAAPLAGIESAAAHEDRLTALAAFMKKVPETFTRGPLSEADYSPVGLLAHAGGLPVRIEHHDPDREGWTTVLTSAETATLRPSVFDVPENYEEVDLLARGR